MKLPYIVVVKRRSLINLTVTFVVVSVISPVSKGYSLDVAEAFYSIFSFPENEIVSFWDINNQELQLSTKYSYLDIYRKKINNTTVLSTWNNQYSVFGFFPLKSNELNSAIAFGIDYDELNCTNN